MPSLLLVTPENAEINRFRASQLNNFTQLTMPYLAGFVPDNYQIELVDEFSQPIPYKPFDLVAITVNTPNAPHVYEMAQKFRRMGSRVVLGGPHVTLLPEEAASFADSIFVGEAEETWPSFLLEFTRGEQGKVYGVTASILTPFPGTELYNQFQREKRLLPVDWSYYNGKTRVAFQPKLLTPEELLKGYHSFRKKFYSWRSILKRLSKSRVNFLYNLSMNFGYRRAYGQFVKK
ncbi:MAG: cobalamin-dependent protein [Eubacteriales bacterium]